MPLPMNNDPIFAFQYSTFLQALDSWKKEQLAAYPHREELIETVALAMQDFMCSRHVHDHKMVVESPAEGGAS